MAKGAISRILLAFGIGALLGAAGTGIALASRLRNERAAFASTLDSFEECRGLAENYRGQLERARSASREIVSDLARTLPEIARIGAERERALGAVRALREVLGNIQEAIEGE